jgi:flagellar hook-associated protein 2
MATISTVTNQQIESLVQQYRLSISNPVTLLENRRTSLNARLSVLAELKAKLSAVNTLAKELKATGNLSAFNGTTFESSLSAVATGTATAAASAGTHSLLVTQLAKADKIISSQLSSAATTIATQEGPGTKTMSISVNGNAVEASFEIAEGDSNNTILTKMAAAVNASAADVTASVVTDTTGTSRLVFTSKQSGSAQAISLTDVSGTVLDSIGLNDSVIAGRTASTATTGGFLYASTALLDAKFKLDGIDITRGTNSISDVLTGVTFELKGVQAVTDTPVTLSIGSDKAAIKTKVQDFLKAYNEALSYLNAKTSVNPENKTREILASDQVFKSLRINLRSVLASAVGSVTSGNPSMLAEVGIRTAADGTLSLSDTAAFDGAVTSSVKKISDLFNSADGIAVRLNALLETFTATGGQLEIAHNGTNNQLSSIKAALTRNTVQINARVESFRKQYESLYNAMTKISLQSQTITSLISMLLMTETTRAVASIPGVTKNFLNPVYPKSETKPVAESADRLKKVSEEEVLKIVDDLNTSLQVFNTELNFSVDQETDKTVIKIVDSASGEVIRQIPAEDALRLASRISKLLGLLVDGNA